MQSGLLEYWRYRNYGAMSMKESCKKFKSEQRLLTLEDLQSAFLILGIGSGLAVGVFLLELIHFKFLKSS